MKIGNDTYRGVRTVTIQPKGVTETTIDLQKVADQNTLEILVLDEFSTPVNGATVCLFTSKAVFITDSTCSNTIASTTTSAQGKAKFVNLSPAFYYSRGRIVLGDVVFKGTDSISVAAAGSFTDTIRIK